MASKTNSCRNIGDDGRNQQPYVSQTSHMPMVNVESYEKVAGGKCPPAPSKSFIKPINGDCNYRVHYEHPSKTDAYHLRATEETKVNVAQSAHEKGDGTPVFRCRKALKFSDSELCSDDEVGSGALDCGDSNVHQVVHNAGTVARNSESSAYIGMKCSSQRQLEKVIPVPASAWFLPLK
jgi:hypothetical protein